MEVVLVMFKEDERREFPLSGEKCILGRRRDCALRIPTGDVSRQHCEMTIGAEEIVVKDLGSTNGTYVNGKRIAESLLKPGDRLQLGPVVFVVQVDGRPAEIMPEHAAAELASAGDIQPDVVGADEDTEEILDLDAVDLDLEDPISAVEAILDDEEKDEE